jgi:hypothetical protein
MVNSGEVGFHNNSYGWKFRVGSGNAYVYDSTYGGGTERRLVRDGDSSLTLSANTPTASSHVATKAYVDSAVSAAGGGYVQGGEYGSACRYARNGNSYTSSYTQVYSTPTIIYPTVSCWYGTAWWSSGTSLPVTCTSGFEPQIISEAFVGTLPVTVVTIRCIKT